MRQAQPQDTDPNANQLTFMQAAANTFQEPQALQSAAQATVDVAGHAIDGWNQAKQPGTAATITGAAHFVEGAGDTLVPHIESLQKKGNDAVKGTINDWAAGRLSAAAETHDGTVRGWMYKRLDSLREKVSNPDNLKRAVGCAVMIKAGVEIIQDLDLDQTRTA